MVARERSREAPAFEGTRRALGNSQPQQGGVQHSVPQLPGSTNLSPELEGGVDGTRPSEGLLPPREGGAAVASPSHHFEGDVAGKPAVGSNSQAVPLRGRRKLDGVSWTFGVGSSSKGVRGRAPPPPVPGTTTVGGRRSTRSLDPRSGGTGVVAGLPPETMEAKPPRNTSSASRDGRLGGNTFSVGQSDSNTGRHAQAVAPPRVLSDAAPHARQPRAIGQPLGESSPPSGSGAGYAGSAKRRKVSEGLLDGHVTADADADTNADAAGSSPDPNRHDNNRLPANSVSPSKPRVLVGGGKEETTSSSSSLQVAGGRCRRAWSSSAPTPDEDGNTATDAWHSHSHSHPHPSKAAPSADDRDAESAPGVVATVAAERSPPRNSVTVSQGEDDATSASSETGTCRDVEVWGPASPAEGVRQERTIAGQTISPDHRRRFGDEAHEELRSEDIDIAMAGGSPELGTRVLEVSGKTTARLGLSFSTTVVGLVSVFLHTHDRCFARVGNSRSSQQ